jgi:HemX protein
MISAGWIYNGIIYLYALSLLFAFSDFLGANRKARRMGTGLLIFVWLLQLSDLAGILYRSHTLIEFSLKETLLLYSWILVTASLLIQLIFRVELFQFFVNLPAFGVLLLPLFNNPSFSTSLNDAFGGDKLLLAHIALAICSYSAFAVSTVFSAMYLILHRQLKGRQWSQTMKRMPSLEAIDRAAFAAAVVGVPLLAASMALGADGIWRQGDTAMLLDEKVIGSLIVFLMYGIIVVQRFAWQMTRVKLSMWNVVAFGVVLVNLLLTNYYSAFHQWNGG